MIDDESLKNIEKLHKMKAEGIISDEEFSDAKANLLKSKPITRTKTPVPKSEADALADDDWLGWIVLPLKRYAEFDRRSRRKEYWMFQLAYVALLIPKLKQQIIFKNIQTGVHHGRFFYA